MTDAEALAMRKELEEHYHTRVAPVGEYCDTLAEYLKIADGYLQKEYPYLHAQLGTLRMVILKSNALNRMLYMGERARFKECPTHKGHWSGIHMSDRAPCACTATDGNITGWLPNLGQQTFNPVWLNAGEMSIDGVPQGMSIMVHRDPKKDR